MRDSRPARQRGFTLLEILVVLAILGIALTLITGYRAPWSGRLELRGTASDIAAALRMARGEAIAQNRPIDVAVDVDGRRLQIDTAAPRQLSPQLKLALLTAASEDRSAGTGAIRFNPDGSSSGGRIAISDGHQTIAIGIDWLTGRVAVADIR